MLSIGLCVAVVVASVVVFATVVVVVAGALIGGRNFKTFSFRVSLSVACSLCVLTCVGRILLATRPHVPGRARPINKPETDQGETTL